MTITHVLGEGCASLMLASRANELNDHRLSVVQPDAAPEPKDHMLGFWGTPDMAFAAQHARHAWPNWSVITETAHATMTSEDHPYHAMHKLTYLEQAKATARQHGVDFLLEQEHVAAQPDAVFDTRPPRAPAGAMLQHFAGLEVEVDRPVFDPTTAVLMDFRVDQSHGMHFMYVLPFSPTRALLESTMFSTQIMPPEPVSYTHLTLPTT